MTTRWMAAILISAAGVSAWGQSNPADRFALTEDQVARTLSDTGIQVVGQQVSLLANVVATEPHPILEVLTVAPLGDESSGKVLEAHSLVKLACRQSGRCLPFYAIVTLPIRAGGAFSTSGSAGDPMLRSDHAITMKAGTHATLLIDDSRSHIQVTVVSLESGSVGHRIRVASPDHKHIYVGEVVSASVLKRSF